MIPITPCLILGCKMDKEVPRTKRMKPAQMHSAKRNKESEVNTKITNLSKKLSHKT